MRHIHLVIGLLLLTLAVAPLCHGQVIPDKITPWEAGVQWVDPGVIVTDDTDPLYNFETPPPNPKLNIAGSVNVTILGSYNLTYSVTDTAGSSASAVRQVDVKDATPPVVTLKGDAIVTIPKGGPWIDPGVTAIDSFAGTLPFSSTPPLADIWAVVGTYTRTYRATDPSGNTASVTRTIKVVGRGPKIVPK